MTMFPSTVTGHAANGVQLSQGSAAIFQPTPAPPFHNVTGNAGFDLACLDAESSFAGSPAPTATINCTGF